QRNRAGKKRRPRSRVSVKGHAMQTRLPANKSAMIDKPRQWVQGRTPARFIELIWCPKRPSAMVINANTSIAACAARRKYRHLIIPPTNGMDKRSRPVRRDTVIFKVDSD